MAAPRAWLVPVGFLAYGLAVGLLTLSWLAPGRDALLPLNLPGYLLGEQLYLWAIRLVGDSRSPQAHFTIPWLLRTPQVVVPASVLFWGLVGMLAWVAGRASAAGVGRATEVVLALLAVAHVVLADFVGLGGRDLARLAWLAAGLAGLVGVALDSPGRSPNWGFVSWLSAVALLVLAALRGPGGLLYALPALLALWAAAFLADGRRVRRGPATRILAGVVGLADLALLAFVVLVAVPWPV